MEPLIVRWRGSEAYSDCFAAMRAFTEARTPATPDEVWLVQHPPVYTLGLAGNPAHLLKPDSAIPLIKTDRGGQITYHGPGQVIAYLMLNLQRRKLTVRALVHRIEQAVIDLLAAYNLRGLRQTGAPGIYLSGNQKIAALGLKIRHGCSYHGVSLNVDMDLRPFEHINPCGYAGLRTIDLASAGIRISWHEAAQQLAQQLAVQFDGAADGLDQDAALPPACLPVRQEVD